MDPSTSKVFGGYCGETIEDACLYLSSHFKFFGIGNYGDNKDCTITIDSGKMAGALHKYRFLEFNLQADCNADYLEIYDADHTAISASNKVGRFCGNYINMTGWPTQRYTTFVFHTDGSGGYSGFKARAVRYEPTPCQDDEFECVNEAICIDSRLKCDGTKQCDDGSDETGWEKMLGEFLALGLAGIATVSASVIAGCVGICIVIGAFTCCKKCCAKLCSCCPCACCKKCCRVPSEGGRGSSRVRPGTEMSDRLELADVEDNDDSLPPKPDTAYTNVGYDYPPEVVYDDNFPAKPDTAYTNVGYDEPPEVVEEDYSYSRKHTTMTRLGSSNDLERMDTMNTDYEFKFVKGWEKMLGEFLALGLAGIATVSASVITGCVGICIVIGAFTCCKKCCAKLCSCCPCACCKKCCRVPSEGGRGSSRVRPGTEMSDRLELADVEDNDDSLPPKPDTAYTNVGYDDPPEVVYDDNRYQQKHTTITKLGSSSDLERWATDYDFKKAI
ncbi:hypothetical protein KUTeg_019210 [Tegillarca granosa]|uniref:CUB domain-containing protein n=1 Tax=Tegillarca granosa TaxID=220873 RepID=A0ABQ9EBV2_TEGGR|nr:hypothetical protein KUTeg_019210 [Tegillarca granosa]